MRSQSLTPRAVLLLCALALAVGVPGLAHAHDRTHSYSTWRFQGAEVYVTVRLSELDTTHFEWGLYPAAVRDRELAHYLLSHLQLFAGAEKCVVTAPPRNLHPGAGRLAVAWSLRCPESLSLRLRSDVLFDIVPNHLHFVRIEGLGPSAQERVLTAAQRDWILTAPAQGQEEPPSRFLDYVVLGIEHIATGYDHLAFVLALILVGSSFASLAKVVTSFTVAHSVTLAFSVLGWVRPQASAVEALIGFSIALVATENLWIYADRRWEGPWVLVFAAGAVAVLSGFGVGNVPLATAAGVALFTAGFFGLAQHVQRLDSLRWSVAFLFGLVHGFGFASVLTEAGLPPATLVYALAGFNLGVELGQIAVIATVWPALRWLRKAMPRMAQLVVEVGSAFVLAFGGYWFLLRTYG